MTAAALRRVQHGTLLVLLTLAARGCLEVQSPLQVPAEDLNDPKKAPVLALSVQADFECAFANYAAITAALTDEFATAAPPANSQIDARSPRVLGDGQNTGCNDVTLNGASNQWYVPLQTARLQAEENYRRILGFADSLVAAPPGKPALLATVAAYGGYVYTLFAEGACSTSFDLQAPMLPPAVFAIAEQRFTTADSLAQLVSSTALRSELRNFVHVGRARARLGLGSLDSAAADARFVTTTTYARNATFTTGIPRRQNQVWVRNQGLATVDPRFRGLQIGGVDDPRVPARDAGFNGTDGLTRIWSTGKYTTDASPIPLATWDEAQLIIAEAEGGQSAVQRINALRLKYSLPQFASTDPDTIMAEVREERRRTLFVQGHRLNDMLRFGIPFDTGPGYGNVRCLPMPSIESENNPNVP